jgi:plastocyanin
MLRPFLAVLVAAFGLCACTDGAPSASAATSSAGAVTIVLDLGAFPITQLAAGTSGSFSPAVTTVAVGTQIQFRSLNNFAHTASAVAGTTFPQASPLTGSALTPSASGTGLSTPGWTSGQLASLGLSPVFVADKPGTYLYGCFFHYPAPMRGEIIVQ